mmetsp:Transcript_87594/g.250992  ORF Transcript_87594/g.250992 Transcript_87594/m.250992 type:complete len:106 (-) Transcript_87594:704-1021(-)
MLGNSEKPNAGPEGGAEGGAVEPEVPVTPAKLLGGSQGGAEGGAKVGAGARGVGGAPRAPAARLAESASTGAEVRPPAPLLCAAEGSPMASAKDKTVCVLLGCNM